jgi:hypothetical protein
MHGICGAQDILQK